MPATRTAPRASVLLVEDDLDTRDMYRMWLEHVGFDVFASDSADEGFQAALRHQPQVVVTDFLLRRGDSGADLCRRLKRDPRTGHIPTLLVTGSAERRTVDGALDAGCAIVRLKPYLPDAMLDDIRSLLRGEQPASYPVEHASPKDDR